MNGLPTPMPGSPGKSSAPAVMTYAFFLLLNLSSHGLYITIKATGENRENLLYPV
jgi:hypothetical protein